jgi:2-polyprenyl-3-methyl-5-hydroxy-6-metoxy-1,4-benzoquinol methylase
MQRRLRGILLPPHRSILAWLSDTFLSREIVKHVDSFFRMAEKIKRTEYPDSLSHPGFVLPTAYVTFRGRFGKELLALIADYAPSEAEILDLNAGTGEIGEALISKGFKYRILEQNPELRKIHAEKDLISEDWRIPKTDLPSERFDLILAVSFIEHIPTWIAAFELMLESRRLLKPGGALLVISPNAPGNGRAFYNDYKHGWYVSRTRLADMASDAGLKMSESRYTLGWITMSGGLAATTCRFLSRIIVAVLNVTWVSRTLDGIGLSGIVRKVDKTLFEQVVVRLTK